MNKTIIAILLLICMTQAYAYSTSGDGRDGNLIVTTPMNITNYTHVTASIAKGATNFTIANCAAFPNGSDIVLMDMSTTAPIWGRHEEHVKVTINASCFVTLQPGDVVNFTTSSKVQVIRVPNYIDVTVNNTGNITAPPVNWATGEGGVVAFRFSGRYVGGSQTGTGMIVLTDKGFERGDRSSTCASAKTGYGYTGGNLVDYETNDVGGGGGNINGGCSARHAGGGGGASQIMDGTAGVNSGGAFGGSGGKSTANTNASLYLQIGGGGGGSVVWDGGCPTASAGTPGAGVLLVWGNEATNFSMHLGTGGAGGSVCAPGGEGGAGAALINIKNLNVSFMDARAGYAYNTRDTNGRGGNGLIAGFYDTLTITGTNYTPFTRYGSFIPNIGNVPITLSAIPDVTQNWNATFTLQVNATNSTDCNVSTYSTNDTNFPIDSTTGIINLGANFSRANMNRSVQISVNDTCGNTLTTTTRIAFTYNPIGWNITPEIDPRPTGTTSDLTCNYSINKPDGQNSTTTLRWFQNSTARADLENLTVVRKGNLTLGDHWICGVTSTDTITTIPWTNSTTLTLGDSTSPLINTITLSTLSPTVLTPVTIDVNTTDNEGIGNVIAQINSPSTPATNWTMTHTDGDIYEYNYTPGVPETYTIIIYSIDGSGNKAIGVPANFTASNPPTPSGGGGGSGGTTVVSGDACHFAIVKPVNGYVNAACSAGAKAAPFEFTIYNQESTEQTYTMNFTGVDCTIDQSITTIPGQSYYSGTVSNCTCPTNDKTEGNLYIEDQNCNTELPIQLYNSKIAKILNNPNTLFGAGILILIILAAIAGIILLK